MDTVNFLEQIANSTFYGEETHKLISGQPTEIQKAFLENDAELMKINFSNVGYLATPIEVVQI